MLMLLSIFWKSDCPLKQKGGSVELTRAFTRNILSFILSWLCQKRTPACRLKIELWASVVMLLSLDMLFERSMHAHRAVILFVPSLELRYCCCLGRDGVCFCSGGRIVWIWSSFNEQIWTATLSFCYHCDRRQTHVLIVSTITGIQLQQLLSPLRCMLYNILMRAICAGVLCERGSRPNLLRASSRLSSSRHRMPVCQRRVSIRAKYSKCKVYSTYFPSRGRRLCHGYYYLPVVRVTSNHGYTVNGNSGRECSDCHGRSGPMAHTERDTADDLSVRNKRCSHGQFTTPGGSRHLAILCVTVQLFPQSDRYGDGSRFKQCVKGCSCTK